MKYEFAHMRTLRLSADTNPSMLRNYALALCSVTTRMHWRN